MRTLQQLTFATVFATGGAIATALVSTTSSGQDYPSKPIRIIVPFSVGGQTDIVARMIAPKMNENWRQPVVVDNRPGAAGITAGSILVNAPRDGYTLMMDSDGHATSAALYNTRLPFDTLRDFTRVSMVVSSASVLVVAPSLGLKSVKDLIALAKANPGQLNFGSARLGGGTHFTGELFKLAAGVDVVHVPYKGMAEAVTDTLTGRIHFVFSSLGPAVPFIKSGRLSALAVSSAQRSPVLPDVPTVAEAALPGFAYELWFGLFAPARTPRSIVDQISKEVVRIMNLPDIKEQLLNQGLVHRANTPEEFDRFVRAEINKLSKVVKVAGIRVD